jgi:16S rRNA (cytosine967-C5)-methyltransferase
MSPRLAAANALATVMAGKASLGTSLPAQLQHVNERDQSLAQELAFGTARWFQRLDGLASALLEKPLKTADRDLHALLLVGLYQLLFTRIPAHAAIDETVTAAKALKKPWARGMLNAVLRRAQREHVELFAALERDPTIRLSHPRWLQKRLKQAWPEHWEAICNANNLHPPMTLRVNQRVIDRQAYMVKLAEADLPAHKTSFSDQGITLMQSCDVHRLPGFAAGEVSVQDEAAQLATPLLDLAAGQRVLDACCAPGGKTCHILEQETGLLELVALDLEPKRLTRVSDNLLRLGLSAELKAADARELAAWWDGKPFQRILLDAPCSATGVIRRHPDIKLTRQAEDIPALAALQGELLDALWQTLDVGGTLVYATCSVLPEENSQVIGAFLDRQATARELPVEGPYGLPQPHGRQLLPDDASHDGFYLAKLTKIGAEPTATGYTAQDKGTPVL